MNRRFPAVTSGAVAAVSMMLLAPSAVATDATTVTTDGSVTLSAPHRVQWQGPACATVPVSVTTTGNPYVSWDATVTVRKGSAPEVGRWTWTSPFGITGSQTRFLLLCPTSTPAGRYTIGGTLTVRGTQATGDAAVPLSPVSVRVTRLPATVTATATAKRRWVSIAGRVTAVNATGQIVPGSGFVAVHKRVRGSGTGWKKITRGIQTDSVSGRFTARVRATRATRYRVVWWGNSVMAGKKQRVVARPAAR